MKRVFLFMTLLMGAWAVAGSRKVDDKAIPQPGDVTATKLKHTDAGVSQPSDRAKAAEAKK